MARAHGACTRSPYGECSTTRQSPSSSRNRSTTSVRSSGTCPVAARWSDRYDTRVPAASGSRRDRRLLGQRGQLAHLGPERLAELGGPPRRVAVPERQLARLAWRG